MKALVCFGFALLAVGAQAQDQIRLDIEGGAAYQTRNTCAVPADSDKFSYRDLIGRSPFGFARITAQIHDDDKSGYRLLIAPLSFSGVGQLKSSVKFDGNTFAPSTPTYGKYVFNTYRISWWRKWRSWQGVEVRGGWTLLVRDADVAFTQGSKSGSLYNLGIAPLFYLFAEKQVSDRLGWEFELDGLQAPQGSAYDAALGFVYKLTDACKVKARFRYLDGGTGSGSVYNFATVNYLSLGIEYRL